MKLLSHENLQNLSLEALGLLVVYAYKLDREEVCSSNVAFEAALDELKAKNRIKMSEKPTE
jgi:hypothetical protein